MPGLATDRLSSILKAVKKEGRVVISDVARDLDVCEMTVRRDLQRLEEQGLVTRVHGGAVATSSARFDARLASRSPAKRRAAQKLAVFLPDTGTIYLDGSTTMLHLVGQFNSARRLQVATNNVTTFQRLAEVPGVEPLLIAGVLDRRTDNLVGALAVRSVLAMGFDGAFFSSWGITPELGATEVTIEDAEVKDLVAQRAARVYLALDHSKLGIRAAGAWRPDAAKTTLSTDLPPQDERVREYANHVAKIL